LTRALVISPTYCERDNLEPFVARLFDACPTADLLVVDDASPDGTGALADAIATRDDRVRVIHRMRKLGLGTAYVVGFRHALDRRYQMIVQMDADLSHDARDVPRLLSALEHVDLVIGSRSVAGGGIVGWGPGRLLLSRGGSLYARSVLGVHIRDLTSGFKAFRAEALAAIEPDSLRSSGYAFQIETTYRALRRGLAIVELPIVFVDRRVGESKLSSAVVAEAIVAPWRMRLGARP
jgi:dolichol-phosphate mannosyltransferase